MRDDTIVRFATVVEVEGETVDTDYSAGQRIRVRLTPEDNDVTKDNELPWAFPLLPKMMHVLPKVDETVMIILTANDSAKNNRLYIGPVISQPYFMYKQNSFDANSLMESRHPLAVPERNPYSIPENKGTLPALDDIAIEGRVNTDIVLKENEIQVRAGYKQKPLSPDPLQRLIFNDIDMAYIQMKYDNYTSVVNKIVDGKLVPTVKTDFHSVINVVADRINLLSYDSKDCFQLTDRDHLISKEEMAKILNNAHPVIYGDDFMDFMQKFINIFLNHSHNLLQKPALSTDELKTLTTDLSNFLSKSIRVN